MYKGSCKSWGFRLQLTLLVCTKAVSVSSESFEGFGETNKQKKIVHVH